MVCWPVCSRMILNVATYGFLLGSLLELSEFDSNEVYLVFVKHKRALFVELSVECHISS